MFTREGHFWVYPINNKAKGRWIYAFNMKTAKFLYARDEGVRVSVYIAASKKGMAP